MQVNVFITRIEGEPQNQMLVLPLSSLASIPPQYSMDWQYFATDQHG